MTKRTGAILLVLGILCLGGAAGTIVLGVIGFVDSLKPVVTVESPGTATFHLDQAGVHPLWHDYSTSHGSHNHHHDQRPPSDFVYELTRLDDGRAIPFTPLPASHTQTMSTTQRESFGLGSFEVPSPGDYELRAANPAGDQRFFSLTSGSFLGTLGPFGASIGLTALLALAGLILSITGLIGLLAARRRPAHAPA